VGAWDSGTPAAKRVDRRQPVGAQAPNSAGAVCDRTTDRTER
jgi:hypothetical protein